MERPFLPNVPTLVTAVAKALGRKDLRLGDWRVTPLAHRIINQVTAGLYRVEGDAWDDDERLAWALVVKVLQGRIESPESPFPPSQDPTHWNYWRREALVFDSELRERLPVGLTMPACYAVEAIGDDEIHLYMEAVVGAPAEQWSTARFALAARQLGRFQGALRAGVTIFDAPWASRGWLRSWVTGPNEADEELLEDARAWRHPSLAALHGARPMVRRLLAERVALLDAQDAAPRTLCHLDCWSANLLSRPGPGTEAETVVLDWAMLGVDALGVDPANLIFDTVWMLRVDALRLPELATAVWNGYVDGLHEGGWQGDMRLVRYAFTASIALRFGMWSFGLVRLAQDPTRHAEIADRYGETIETVLRARAAVVAHALVLSSEALELRPLLQARS
jgi:hypothetical protein